MKPTDQTQFVLIQGARVVDPANQLDATADILIENGIIIAVGRPEVPAGTVILDADGLIAAPGLVDMHVHLREPGFEYKETIRGGTQAAAAGGVTTVAAMPNTKPVNDDPSITGYILQKARSEGIVNVVPIGAITKGLLGVELTEMGLQLQAGCVAFSDDGRPVADSSLMRRALDYSRAFGALIIQHAEDPSLSLGGCMHEGIISSRLGLPGLPSVAESIMVDRDLRLVALTGGRYHVAHISTAEAVHAVKRAREHHLPVSCEVAPHHFSLTDEAVIGYDTDAKMSPPLRGIEERNALLEGLAQEIITVIATDHAPHDPDSKRVEFCHAANGVVGLETLLPVSLELVRDGVLTLSQCLKAMTVAPARLLGLNRGTLTPGRPADLVLFDLDAPWIVDAARLHGTSRNTCFHGRKVRGRVKKTLVAGRIVYDDNS